MLMKATFRGDNGSLGYVKNQPYELEVTFGFWNPIHVQRLDGTGKCPYGSIKSFLENWYDVTMTRKKK